MSPANGSDRFIAGGCLPYRAVTDRHTVADVHLYPPIRIIGAFNCYSVLIAVGIASEAISKPVAFAPDAPMGRTWASCEHRDAWSGLELAVHWQIDNRSL